MNYNQHEEVLVKLLKEKPVPDCVTSSAVAPPPVVDSEINSDIPDDVKPNFRRGPDERDAIKYAAHLRAKEKRRSLRNRKRGSMKPQGLEEQPVPSGWFRNPVQTEEYPEDKAWTDRPLLGIIDKFGWKRLSDPLESVPEELLSEDSPKKEWVDEVMSVTDAIRKGSESDTMTDILFRMTGFVIGMSNCKSNGEATRMALTVLTQYFKSTYVDEIFKWCQDDLEPQGDDGENIFSTFRNKISIIGETRGGKFLFNVFSLAVMGGYSAHQLVPFNETKYFLKKIEQDIYRSASMKTCMECVLDVGEYVASAYHALSKGTKFKDFIFPNTLQQEIVDCQILSERINSGDENSEDDAFLDETINKMRILEKKLSNLMLTAREAKSSRWMQAGYETVKRARLAVELVQARAGFRYKPICFGLFGKSQIGKTNTVDPLGDVVAAATNRVFLPENRTTMSDREKYEDPIKNNTLMVTFDDVGSIKGAQNDPSGSTAATLVRVINNIAQPTNQSNLINKDRIFHREELVVLTSNVKDFGTREPFNYPLAACNRINMYKQELLDHFKVPGKEILDVKKAQQAQKEVGVGMPEMYTFQKYEFFCPNGDDTKEMAARDIGPKMTTREFFVHVAQISRNHYEEQMALKTLHAQRCKSVMCPMCFQQIGGFCQCTGAVEPALKDLKAQALISSYAFSVFDEMAMQAIWHTSHWFGKFVTGHMSRVIQRNAFRTAVFIITTTCGAVKYLKHKEMRICALFSALWLWYFNYLLWLDKTSVYQMTLIACGLFGIAFLGYGNAIMDAFMYEATKSMLNKQTRSILCSGLAVCSFIGIVRRLYQMQAGADEPFEHAVDAIAQVPQERSFELPRFRNPQGNILPKVYKDVVDRHKETNPWQPGQVKPVVFSNQLKTMTYDQVKNCVDKAFFKITFQTEKRRASCFTLHLCDTIWAVSKHVFESMSSTNCQVELSKPGHPLLVTSVSAHYVPEDPMCDTVLIQLLGIGDFPDTTKFLAEGDYREQALHFVTRRGCELVDTIVYGRMGLISSTSGVLPHTGILYDQSVPTVDGDCGSLLFTHNNPHALVGFHCAGDAQGHCAAAVIRKCWIHQFQQKTIDFLPEGSKPMPFAMGDDVDLDPFSLGEAIVTEFHEEHCVLQRFEPGCHVTPVAYTPHSRVRPKTSMSYGVLHESLKRQGMPIDYGPPQFHVDRDHDCALESVHNGMRTIDPVLMRHCIDDYLGELIPNIVALSASKRPPLTLNEVLNGVDGNRFVGPMKETTAAGFGAKGKKTRDFIDVTYAPTGEKILLPTELLEEKFNEGKTKLESGGRLNCVFRTSLKDEPVKYDDSGPKKANRVFYSCQTDALCLAKSYFGPVASAIFEQPLISECAGGINSFGEEWGMVYQHLMSFGPDQILAGDYKNWDQSVSSQLIRACGIVCLHIAEALGYASADLMAMNGIISDIAVSYISFNGCLTSFDALMPSGTFCTLLFNSIANSLIHRCAFFAPGFEGTFEHKAGMRFRDHCHFLFLGDDSIGTSKILSQRHVQAYCKSINLVYTDDKKSLDDIEPYQNIRDVNFCKRTFRYEPHLNQWLAPLAVASIDKALYMYRDGEMDPITYTVQAVEAQMREYARHEDALFEQRRVMVTNACLDAGIYMLVAPILCKGRQDWLDDFNKRYFTFSVNDFSDVTEEGSI